jgi:chemotaxis protein CheD
VTPPPFIRMGEWQALKSEGIIRTLLGSCIGLALYDRRHCVAGLAHIVLPSSRGTTEAPGKFVDTAVPTLIHAMNQLVRGTLRPTARIVGGANMFATEIADAIGAQNIAASERVLSEMRIPIVGRHCGGEQGRKVTIDVGSGLITIEMVGGEATRMPDQPPRSGVPND